jgi:NTP pyrophosphatase (non-canonical NTP hydrolase)
MEFEQLRQKVLTWADNKSILVPENSHKQALKMVSEVGELCDAIIKNDVENIKNELGDVLVTIIILSQQLEINPVECLEMAYIKIKNRKGVTKNGIFKKD